ncbi:phosphoribosylanthranilate isomerase [Ureibacillus thermophilus]|uniref:N-(5'-phosphoribosyl)anthranilate isomerase n=1 Tax=Ureibacillus thermophilus TaxID=367743 RepID=A0A4P6UUD4_9BACL|nr:phosphoribosylanthranilate isomerase [Ureibacillus thermophilus]QBK25162.1 phosphoribosylanthranilate isomerase [Ureibacillus thermophilus]
MTKVKICGLKENVHVHCAVNAGSDFVGFVFAPSKRQISIEKARELAKLVPNHVKKVGVFVNPTIEEVREAFESVPLDYVQYHGNEDPNFINQLGYPSIKAFSIRDKDDVEKASKFNVDYYLFDAPGTDYAGGSGNTFDWSLLDQLSIPREKVILAGGLNAANVNQAIATVQPFAVDVSSGVEQHGKKSCELIQSFIQAVKTSKRS